ncbi:hypothetical protein ACLKA7_002355 [Drosophila subpalustris]
MEMVEGGGGVGREAIRNLKAVPICPLESGLAFHSISLPAAAADDDGGGNSKRKCTFHTQNPFPQSGGSNSSDVEKDVGATTMTTTTTNKSASG